jgi:hypothetical protein
MCSVDLTHFNILDNGGIIAIRSTIDSIQNSFFPEQFPGEKKIVESSALICLFYTPEINQPTMFISAGEDCLRTAAINKSCFNLSDWSHEIYHPEIFQRRGKEKIFKDCHMAFSGTT